jgi:hypothetical protein
MDITDQALSSAGLMDAENSTHSFSNVAVRHLDNDRLSLALDITKHAAIVESTDSGRVRKILMHACTSSPTGAVGHFQTKSVKGKNFLLGAVHLRQFLGATAALPVSSCALQNFIPRELPGRFEPEHHANANRQSNPQIRVCGQAA